MIVDDFLGIGENKVPLSWDSMEVAWDADEGIW